VELRHLRCLVALSEELHFGRAAKRLGLSQPPLSHHIRTLEAELGVPLFQRNNRRVVATPASEALAAQARQILASCDTAMNTARRVGRGEAGHLAVGFLHWTAHTLLPPIMRAFRAAYPDVEVTLQELATSQQIEAIAQGRIAAGFVWLPIANPEIATEPVFREPFVAALPAAHALAARARIPVAALAGQPIVMFWRQPNDVGLHGSVSAILREAAIVPNVVQTVNTLLTAVGLVSAGAGLALVPRSVARLQLAGVVYRPLTGAATEASIALAWKRDNPSPLLARFLDTARQALSRERRATDDRGAASPKISRRRRRPS
jgi:DNA-binding transcriptional LysR family regulator